MRPVDLAAHERHLAEVDALDRERLEAAVPAVEFLAELAAGEAGPWRAQAACKGDTATMYATTVEGLTAALTVCQACTVADECRRWGDRTESRALQRDRGVIGGETVDQRRTRRAANVAA